MYIGGTIWGKTYTQQLVTATDCETSPCFVRKARQGNNPDYFMKDAQRWPYIIEKNINEILINIGDLAFLNICQSKSDITSNTRFLLLFCITRRRVNVDLQLRWKIIPWVLYSD
jgi:hypothetical protein